jgi:hypothetical protein
MQQIARVQRRSKISIVLSPDWMAPKYAMNWPRIGSSQSVGKSGGSVCPKLTFLGPALAK